MLNTGKKSTRKKIRDSVFKFTLTHAKLHKEHWCKHVQTLEETGNEGKVII